MAPSELITSTGDLTAALSHRLQELEEEARQIRDQWARLKRIGGCREEHAAALLSRLSPFLGKISGFCETCQKQVEQAQSDPYKEDAA